MANIENLRRAVEHLKTIDQSQFDMSFYVANIIDGEKLQLYYPKNVEYVNECGTVGCVVGHCAVLDPDYFKKKVINRPSHLKELNPYLYTDWSERFFDVKDEEWEWLFGERWSVYDNTISGAIARIELYVNQEKTPDEFYEADFKIDVYFEKYGNKYLSK